jgi:hypothetical protein
MIVSGFTWTTHARKWLSGDGPALPAGIKSLMISHDRSLIHVLMLLMFANVAFVACRIFEEIEVRGEQDVLVKQILDKETGGGKRYTIAQLQCELKSHCKGQWSFSGPPMLKLLSEIFGTSTILYYIHPFEVFAGFPLIHMRQRGAEIKGAGFCIHALLQMSAYFGGQTKAHVIAHS